MKKVLIVSVSDKSSSCDQTLTFNIFLLGHEDFPSTSQTHLSLHREPSPTYTNSLSDLISGMLGLQVDPLCHLPGAVQRHSHPHGGHHHGDGVDETALRLHLHLTWDLPLHEMRRDDAAWWDQSLRLNFQSSSFYHFWCDDGSFKAPQGTHCTVQRWNNIFAYREVFAVFLIFHAASYATWTVEYSLYGADYIRWPPHKLHQLTINYECTCCHWQSSF